MLSLKHVTDFYGGSCIYKHLEMGVVRRQDLVIKPGSQHTYLNLGIGY